LSPKCFYLWQSALACQIRDVVIDLSARAPRLQATVEAEGGVSNRGARPKKKTRRRKAHRKLRPEKAVARMQPPHGPSLSLSNHSYSPEVLITSC